MTLIPPVSLVLDITALVSGSQREWREFSRIGRTHIPQAVYEEMRLLFDRSPDPDLEALCKAFNHFYPTSGWQTTDVHAHHPTLTATGHGLTHRTRIALASARCAYALALASPTHLVVLVTRDQSRLQRMSEIALANLCAIDAAELLQWSRSGQRPIAVSQKLQQLRSVTTAMSATGMVGTTGVRTSPSRITTPASRPTAYRPVQTQAHYQSQAARGLPAWVPQLVSLSLALGCVAIAGWVLWGVVHQNGWLEFLRQPVDPVQQAK